MRNFSFPIGDFEEGVMWVSQTVPPQNSTLVHCGWHWEGRCFAQHLCNSELVDQAKMDYIFVCSGHCCGHSQKWGLGVRSRIGWGWDLNFRLISSVTSCKCLHDSSLKSLTLWIQRGMWSAAARIGFRPGLHVCLWMWLRLIRANSVFGILLNGAEVFSCHFVRPGAYSYLVCREINVKSEYAEKPEPLLFSVRTALTFVPVSPQFLKICYLHKSPDFPRSSAVCPVGSSHPPAFAPSSGTWLPIACIVFGKCFFTWTESLWFCFPEIPLVLYLFALISITWLWGGLHMAYRHLWMLVFFIIFNSLQVRAATASFCPADIWCLGWTKLRNK